MNKLGAGSIVAFLDVIACGFGAVVLMILIAPVGELKTSEKSPVYREISSLIARIEELSSRDALASIEIDSLERNIAEFSARKIDASTETNNAKSSLHEVKLKLEKIKREIDSLSFELASELKTINVPDRTLPNFMYGIPVNSEYLVFVIDTSGSMQAIWSRVVRQVETILKEYPNLRGFRILSDDGEFLISDSNVEWLLPNDFNRDRAIRKLKKWRAYSNSSPVEGIEIATKNLFRDNLKMAILVFGDDYPGNDFDGFLEKIRAIRDRATNLSNNFRIHAFGFSNEQWARYPERFSRLMQRLTFENGGAYLHISEGKKGRVDISRGRSIPNAD